MLQSAFRKNIPALLLLFPLANCASIVSENESVTYIETDPENARCELHGQDFKRVIHTPDSMQLPAEAAPITVACSAENYRTTSETLDTSADGWIVGNILFGGIIGIAIDAARGAGEKYPPKFSLILDPKEFSTEDERDAYYSKRELTVRNKWNKTITELEEKCENEEDTAYGNEDCLSLLDKAKSKKKEELKKIQRNKETSEIQSNSI